MLSNKTTVVKLCVCLYKCLYIIYHGPVNYPIPYAKGKGCFADQKPYFDIVILYITGPDIYVCYYCTNKIHNVQRYIFLIKIMLLVG